MPKIVRITLYSLGAAVLLTVLGMAAILLFVDPNDFKDDITSAAYRTTGRELSLEGDIKLSVFPWLGLSLGRTALGNAPGFGDQPMLRAEAVDIQVRLLPLLKKQLEMKTVQLRGLQLNLARRADGSTNWDDLTGPAAEPTPPGRQATPASGPPPLAALVIGGVELRDARVVWDDRLAGQRIVLDNLQLQTGPLAPPEPVDVSLSTDLATSAPALQTHIEFASRITPNLASRQFTFGDLRLTLDSRGEGLPANQQRLSLGAKVDADLARQLLTVSGLQVDTLGTRLRGSVNLRHWQDGDAQLSLDITDPQPLAALLPDLSAGLLSKAALTTEAHWNLGQQMAQVKTLRIQAAGLQLDAQLDASHIIDAPQAQGRLSVAEFSPRRLAQSAAIALPETSDPKVLDRASLALDFTGSLDAFRVQKLKLQADDSILSGNASVANFAQPAIRFELGLDGIDIDRYLPPASDTPPPAPAGAAVEAAQLPLEPLRALDVEGRLTIGRLKAAKARLTDILLAIKAKDGRLRLHPAQAKLYGGSYAGDIRMDVRDATPKLALDETLKDVQAGPLLKDVLGDDKLSGTANLRATLSAQGGEPAELIKTLDGKARMSFRDGMVKGINIGQQLRSAQAKLRGQPAPPEAVAKTDFAELSASATIAKGVVTNRDLQASSPLLRISGEGTVDLPRERLDYRLTTTVVNTATGQAGKELEQLKGLPIPIRIKGPFADPKISLDLKPVLDAKLKQELARQKRQLKQKADEAVIREREKLKEKAKEDVKKGLDKALKGLLR